MTAVVCARASTVAKALDDGEGLKQWYAATTVQTVAHHPDLADQARMTPPDAPWKEYRAVVEEAEKRRGKPEAQAGTNLHTALQAVVEGRDTGHMPPDIVAAATLAAHELRQLGCVPVMSERFTAALTQWAEPVAGTPDLVVEHDRRLYIADLKTTSGAGRKPSNGTVNAWVVQTTVYAHGQPYPPGYTPGRDRWGRPLVDPDMAGPWPGAIDLGTALILHLDRDDGGCASWEVDLDPQLVDLAVTVRRERRRGRDRLH